MKTQTGEGIVAFHPYFDIWHTQDGRVVSSTHRSNFNPKVILVC
jgi:hypothetical protein